MAGVVSLKARNVLVRVQLGVLDTNAAVDQWQESSRLEREMYWFESSRRYLENASENYMTFNPSMRVRFSSNLPPIG